MTPITFWFDPISPYAHLAFQRLPQALAGRSVVVDHKPVLFGALLKHHAHKGPAEIEPKRQWTFRQVAWLAHRQGTVLDLPAQHPFNPLTLLRLLLSTALQAPHGLPHRQAVATVFRHVWEGGEHPLEPQRLASLAQALEVPPFEQQPPAQQQAVKDRLRAHGDEAIAKGVFGVPTFECQGRLFWGLDALDMLCASLDGDPWFDRHWAHAARQVPGLTRPA